MRRSLQLSLFAVVLLGLVGGSLAFFLAQKSVTLTVDGQVQTVGTYASTVAEVLDEEGLEPAEHDVLLPQAEQALADGDAVVLNRARPLELTVDGVSREVYVTALSVDEALEQLGLRADGLVLSASRSERLPLQGMELTITTPKDVVLVADGQERVVTTTAATAGDLLAEQGIALSETDRTSLYLTQGLLDRMRLQVFRVQVSEVSETTTIEAERVETPDPDAFIGDEKVTDARRRRREGHRLPRHRRRRCRDRPRGAEHRRSPASRSPSRSPSAPRPKPAVSRVCRRPQLGGPGQVRVRWPAERGQQHRQVPRHVPVLHVHVGLGRRLR